MASLREIKDRIGSVRSTLKITSAMKLVASAKLRKAQKAIEGMRPYERTLAEILATIQYGGISPEPPAASSPSSSLADPSSSFADLIGESPARKGKTAVIAIASNSSLCGGFNANAVRKALETIRACRGEVEIHAVGRRMTDALRRAGYDVRGDYNDLIGHPTYAAAAELARSLKQRYEAGELSRVILVYNRFASTTSQIPTAELYLPFRYGGISPELPAASSPFPTLHPQSPGDGRSADANFASLKVPSSTDVPTSSFAGPTSSFAGPTSSFAGPTSSFAGLTGESRTGNPDFILEPSAQTLVGQLLPQVLILKFYAAILDSAAAEHAARVIAMQTATDNAEDLLGELTLEYNKGRQQKITSEILDLLGGAAE